MAVTPHCISPAGPLQILPSSSTLSPPQRSCLSQPQHRLRRLVRCGPPPPRQEVHFAAVVHVRPVERQSFDDTLWWDSDFRRRSVEQLKEQARDAPNAHDYVRAYAGALQSFQDTYREGLADPVVPEELLVDIVNGVGMGLRRSERYTQENSRMMIASLIQRRSFVLNQYSMEAETLAAVCHSMSASSVAWARVMARVDRTVVMLDDRAEHMAQRGIARPKYRLVQRRRGQRQLHRGLFAAAMSCPTRCVVSFARTVGGSILGQHASSRMLTDSRHFLQPGGVLA